jgi:mRNA interferase MazF
MQRGSVVLVDLPAPASSPGREQVGTRPALIVQNDATSSITPTIMVVPFTSKSAAARFPHTIAVQPSAANGLSCPSVLLVFQLRAIDKRRVVSTIGSLERQTLDIVDAEMRLLLEL